MTYEAIEANGESSGRTERRHRKHRTRTPRVGSYNGIFQTPDGLRAYCPCSGAVQEQLTDDYPFVLNTGRTVEHWHTRTRTANVPILERLSPRSRGAR